MSESAAKTRNQKTHTHTVRRGVSIYKTASSPFWYARVYDSVNRRYIVKSTKMESRIHAIEATNELIQHMAGSPVMPSKPKRNTTFGYFADRVLLLSKAGKGKYVAKDDAKIIERKGDGLRAYFGVREVATITAAEIIDYFLTLNGSRDKPIAESTKNKHVIVLRKIFNAAIDDGVMTSMPKLPKQSSRANPRAAFTDAEYKHLLNVIRDCIKDGMKVRGHLVTDEMYYLTMFLANSFLRPTEKELFGMRNCDVEKIAKPKSLHIKLDGKTKYRTTVTMPAAVDFYDRQIKFTQRGADLDYVFLPHEKDRSKAQDIASRMFSQILIKAELAKDKDGNERKLYSLRHYCIQLRLIKSGGKVNVYTLAKNAGTSVEMIEKFYAAFLAPSDEMIENLQFVVDNESDGTQ